MPMGETAANVPCMKEAQQVLRPSNSREQGAVGKVWPADQLPCKPSPAISPEEAVGAVTPIMDKGSYVSPAACDVPFIVLYRNENIIREMHSRVSPDSLLEGKLVDRMGKAIRSLCSTCPAYPYEGNVVLLRPSIEWILSEELGAELRLQWSMASQENVDNIILMLLVALPTTDVESMYRYSGQRLGGLPAGQSVRPSTLIKVRGVIRGSKDITEQGLCLHNYRHSVRIHLGPEFEPPKDVRSLRRRYIYALGVIRSVSKLTIEAGAVLVGESIHSESM